MRETRNTSLPVGAYVGILLFVAALLYSVAAPAIAAFFNAMFAPLATAFGG